MCSRKLRNSECNPSGPPLSVATCTWGNRFAVRVASRQLLPASSQALAVPDATRIRRHVFEDPERQVSQLLVERGGLKRPCAQEKHLAATRAQGCLGSLHEFRADAATTQSFREPRQGR